MPGNLLRVLIIDTSEPDYLQLLAQLRQGDWEPEHVRVETADRFHIALREKWDIILCEYLLPQFGALEALRVLNDRGSEIPLIVVSSTMPDRSVHAALAAGAGDFVGKNEPIRLNGAISRELRAAAARHERRSLEEQFRHSQRLEAVGRLAGGVAHDFNNLLTIVCGWTELLLSTNGLDEIQRDALEEVRKAAQRGGALAHRLLAFSRRQPLAPRIVHLNEVLVGLEKMLRPIIGEDINVVTLASARSDTVRIDPGQFEQVILNLVVNARDAMPNGGTLTIEASEDFVDADRAAATLDLKPGHHVVVSIADTGVGMDADTKSHIFEPFFTTKPSGRGTGLGLATAYGIVRQSGGAISVISELGVGTAITIHLPQVAAPAEAGREADVPDVSADGCETILVVEDEPRVRKLIRDGLRQRGYQVIEASRGTEALAWIESHPGTVDLAILDVVMPEMSGPEVGQEISSLRPETRLLYISGYADEAIIHHGILDKGAAFIQKPFLPNALAAKVRQVLDAARSAVAAPQ